MSNESADKMNSLSEWLLEHEYIKKSTSKAVVWPDDLGLATDLAKNLNYTVATVSPLDNNALFLDTAHVYQINATSHAFVQSEKIDENIDLEYGWALASDTVNSLEEGLSKEDAMRKIADTSDAMLANEGYAIYNLESTGSRYDLPLDNKLTARERQLEYGEAFKDILEDEYSGNVTLHDDPEFSIDPHLVWQK